MAIRVLVVDDQPTFRANVKALLELEPDVEVVGEANSGEAALENAAALHPDITLMDLGMPGMDGLQATRRLASAGGRVLVLSSWPEDEGVALALQAGSRGYVSKTRADRDLPPALRAVARGEQFLGAAAQRALRGVVRAGGPSAA